MGLGKTQGEPRAVFLGAEQVTFSLFGVHINNHKLVFFIKKHVKLKG